MPPTERAKAESPVLADFLESARKNGYDPLLAEAMVRVDTPLHLLRNEHGDQRVVGDKESAPLLASGWKPAVGVQDPINPPGTLLTVGPDLAVQLGLAKAISPSPEALAGERGYNIVADLSPGPGERLVELLASTPARFLLILIFLQSLYIVLHAPGHGAAEAVAVVAFAVLVGVPLATGYAQWWEILVVLLGLALCAFEVLVFPGHGVSLAVGGLMVIFGLVMTFAGPVPGQPSFLPANPAAWHGVERGLVSVLGALFCSVILSIWMRKYLPKLPYFNRLILTATSGTAIRQTPAYQKNESALDTWPFVGTVGVATSGLRRADRRDSRTGMIRALPPCRAFQVISRRVVSSWFRKFKAIALLCEPQHKDEGSRQALRTVSLHRPPLTKIGRISSWGSVQCSSSWQSW